MWLINTSTLSLELFHGDKIHPYAILSHTWGDDEVSFQEFTQLSEAKNDKTTNKDGYRKITAACAQALKDGYSYAWIDTCCIDKTSSAELTEAINSMFSWYRKSRVCYVYLSDFKLAAADVPWQREERFDVEFRHCRWFTRGWCLQELLAPRQLRFFNQRWQEIGSKGLLSHLISEITGVPQAVLAVPPKREVQAFPIAARISWISQRQTTRIEDLSYSLLGILDVNMPMLYGEGQKAFLRLQEEIIKKYNDLSIFAWNGSGNTSGFIAVLAGTPSSFVINPIDHYRTWFTRSRLGDRLSTQFSLTNQGVFFPSAKLHYQTAIPGYRHHYLLPLNYQDPSFRGISGPHRYIYLQKVGPGLFIRLYDWNARLTAFRTVPCTSAFYEAVCILNNPRMFPHLVHWERYAVRLRWKPWEKLGRRYWHIRAAQPREIWDNAGSQFLLEMSYERHMHIEFVPGNYESNPSFRYFVLVIQIGDDRNRDPANVSVRISSAEVWEGVTVTMLGSRKREALALEALPPEQGNHISLVGYAISVSVKLVREPKEEPYNLVYLNWEEVTSIPSAND
ncbi:Heterokaryon incompatibility protein (HET) domain containing protein [Hyaloscypha variabilis]